MKIGLLKRLIGLTLLKLRFGRPPESIAGLTIHVTDSHYGRKSGAWQK
jgi:hypothetical protein